MKLNGILGTGSGKLGSSVFSVVGGVQVLREYNPDIYNPSTQQQVDQRARLKLMAQVASAFQPINAFEKKRNVSSRNKFISANYPYTYATEGTAEIKLEDIQIAEGSIPLPDIIAKRIQHLRTEVEFTTISPLYLKRVFYAYFQVEENDQLVLYKSAVVEYSEDNPTFKYSFDNLTSKCVIYAYGMRDYNAAATAALGNYQIDSAQDIAKLISQRSINPAYYTFSRTRGYVLPREGINVWQQVVFNAVDLPANVIVDVPYQPSYNFLVRFYSQTAFTLLIDNQHFPYQLFTPTSGRYEGQVNGFVGGEIVSFVVGVRETLDDFSEVNWYSSQVRIGEQGAQLTSVTVNGTYIPAEDILFVPISSLVNILCSAINSVNMRLRMYVNGVASTTVPLENGEGEITTDTLQVGDELSFVVGSQFLDGFRVKSTFGGKVRITDETPAVNSLVIRDVTISAGDFVEVESGQNVPITILTAGLIGAHVLVSKNGDPYEDTGITITAGATQFVLDLESGDELNFAVGWGQVPSAALGAEIGVS